MEVTVHCHEEVSRIIQSLWLQYGNAFIGMFLVKCMIGMKCWKGGGGDLHDRKPKSQAGAVCGAEQGWGEEGEVGARMQQ